MNKLTAYRNAVDCWLGNDAQVGEVVPNGDALSKETPKCMFGMDVKKGSWKNLVRKLMSLRER